MILLFYYNQNSTLNSSVEEKNFDSNYYFSNDEFFWPVPGFHTITSPFGLRKSPTSGASSTHSGIDIAAPQNTVIFSVTSGKVIFTGFQGANGYTITIRTNNLDISYSHVSPSFLVSIGQIVNIGEQIGNVGPKNVFGIPNNPYKDSNGNPTNGATTRLSFTLKHKKRRHSRQSFGIFLNSFHI